MWNNSTIVLDSCSGHCIQLYNACRLTTPLSPSMLEQCCYLASSDAAFTAGLNLPEYREAIKECARLSDMALCTFTGNERSKSVAFLMLWPLYRPHTAQTFAWHIWSLNEESLYFKTWGLHLQNAKVLCEKFYPAVARSWQWAGVLEWRERERVRGRKEMEGVLTWNKSSTCMLGCLGWQLGFSNDLILLIAIIWHRFFLKWCWIGALITILLWYFHKYARKLHSQQ